MINPQFPCCAFHESILFIQSHLIFKLDNIFGTLKVSRKEKWFWTGQAGPHIKTSLIIPHHNNLHLEFLPLTIYGPE